MTLWFVLVALLVVVGLMLRHVVGLNRDLRGRMKRERSLRHMARTLSGAVSVQKVAQQAAEDAVICTRALGAFVEHTRDGAIEVIAAAGESTPSASETVDYDDSYTGAVGTTTEPIRMKAGAMGLSVVPYLDGRRECAGFVVPLSVQEGTDDARGALVLLSDPEYGNVTQTESAYARALGDLVTSAMRRTLLVERERAARTEAETAVRDRDQVLRVVAHDLKNPLHTISMVSQLLVDVPCTEAEYQEQLRIVRRTVDRMSRLVRDLLDATRVQSGHVIPPSGYGQMPTARVRCASPSTTQDPESR